MTIFGVLWWKFVLFAILFGIIIDYLVPLLVGIFSMVVAALSGVIYYLLKKVKGSINGKFISKKN
jgi:hypothetical protein